MSDEKEYQLFFCASYTSKKSYIHEIAANKLDFKLFPEMLQIWKTYLSVHT